jgi:dolichyl-phosphate-mannose-protein mannosyltransferase
MSKLSPIIKNGPLLSFGLVLVLSYFTYFHNYSNPSALFWDENYHIASAQKYMNGIFFMEQHPPLGKMLIALGEVIIDGNEIDDQFIGTDYGKNLSEGFSFAGYRFFPTLLAWLTAPLFFLLLYLISRNHLISLFLSFFYVFDNALIVHSRSAMLEGPLMFFTVLTTLMFLLLLEQKDKRRKFALFSVLIGISFGLALSTKLTALILILFIPALLWRLWPRYQQFMTFLGLFLLGSVVTFLSIWYIHFAIGTNISPDLSNNGYYEASSQSRVIIDEKLTGSFIAFPTLLRDALKFPGHYNRGVPRLDLCKKDENGSPFYFWPLGARSINYRWETPDSKEYRYLYLQVNPAVWWLSSFGVLLAIGMFIMPLFFSFKQKLKRPFLLVTFLGLYISYMITMSQLDRVMYLYHYFLPLFFSFVIFALVFMEIEQFGPWRLRAQRKITVCLVMGMVIFFSFQFFRPFTYYQPLDDNSFMKRAIFQLWELRCVNCPRESSLVIPNK